MFMVRTFAEKRYVRLVWSKGYKKIANLILDLMYYILAVYQHFHFFEYFQNLLQLVAIFKFKEKQTKQ